MPDTWLLVFIARGILASAGNVMPLDQCIDRMQWHESAACINTHDPACRVNKDTTAQPELRARCIQRMRKQ